MALLLGTLCFVAFSAVVSAQAFTASRSVSSATYTAGGTLNVTVTMDKGDLTLGSLVVQDTIPAGWTYASHTSSGGVILVQPTAGAEGTLEWAWINFPTTWPATLSYTVNVPAGATGAKTFEGQVLYRETVGGEISVPMSDTSVSDGVTTTYTVTLAAAANGSLTGDTNQTVASGSSSTAVEAVGDAGYRFKRWTLDGTTTYSTENPLVINNVTTDLDLTAEFELATYTVSFAAEANGTVTGDLGQLVNEGEDAAEVTAVPNANYHFVNWVMDGTAFSTVNPLTVTNVTEDMTLTAVFEIDTYTVTFNAGANGDVDGDTTQTVDHGADADAVTAAADTGYHFVRWTMGGAEYSTANPLSIPNVTEDVTVTAEFAINEYSVTFAAGANGTVSGDLDQTIVHGANATEVTATPDANYVFAGWDLDGTTFSTANPYTLMDVTQDLALTAMFEPDQNTVTFATATGGSVSGDLAQTLDHGADATPVTATPDEGYEFQGWFVDGTVLTDDNPLTLTNVTEDMAVTAVFQIKTYVVKFVAGENGSITGDTHQTVDHGDDATPVTAVPDGVYVFLEWSDGSTENPRTLTNVTENMTLTALFGDPSPVDPDGIFSITVDEEQVAMGRGIWDFTGHYEEPLNGHLLIMDIQQDARGRIMGTGELRTNYMVPAKEDVGGGIVIPLDVRGRVRGRNGQVLVKLRLRGRTVCEPCSPNSRVVANIRMDLVLDQATERLIGIVRAIVRIGRDREKIFDDVIVDIPGKMDGTWTLIMEMVQDGRKVDGTAALELSNGSVSKDAHGGSTYMLVLKGRTRRQDDTVRLRVIPNRGYDASALGIRMNLLGTTIADGTFEVDKARAKALGVVLKYEDDGEDHIIRE